jgi:hypothetical protein
MIRYLLLLLCVLNAAVSVAQLAFGNEWVDHGRRHWRFSVVEEGIHRIDSTTLANAGFPVGMVDPADLMLFGRQQQVPIHVQGGEDGVLNANDFIEFYATGNDGWLDQQMYANPAHMPNPYYSLYNDTIRYFLTWDPDATKLRIPTYDNTDYAAHVIRPWAWGETLSTFNQAYNAGLGDPIYGASSGFMIEGEGWMRLPVFNASSANNGMEQTFTLATPRSYSGAGAPPMRVTTSSASLNNPGGAGCADHHLILSYGPAPGQVVLDTIFTGVKVLRTNFEVPQSLIATNLAVRFAVPYDLFGVGQVGTCNPSNYTDRQSVGFIRLRYPRDFNFQNSSFRKVWVPADAADPIAHLDFGNFSGTPLMYAWGDTLRRVLPTQAANRWKALVPTLGAGEEMQVVVQSQQSIIAITQLQQVNGTGFFIDYAALEADSALLIVAHASLMPGAQQYKNYRENLAPTLPIDRRMPTVVVDVEDLYDQFGGGVPKNAFAIRRFARYVVNTWETDPRGLILLGKSVQTATFQGSVGYRSNGTAAQAAASPR